MVLSLLESRIDSHDQNIQTLTLINAIHQLMEPPELTDSHPIGTHPILKQRAIKSSYAG